MQIKKILSFLVVIIMIAQPFSLRAIEGQNDFGFDEINYQKSFDSRNSLSTDAVGGEETIKESIVPDGGFTEEDANGAPEYFSVSSSAFQNANFTFQDNVHTGTYSGYIYGKGSRTSYSTAYGYTTPADYVKLNGSVTLDFWYNAYSNPDILSNGVIYAYVYIYSASGTHGLSYYFSLNGVLGSNTTNYGYYDMRGGLSTWFHFSRNLTSDFEDACKPVTPDLEIRNIYFYTQSPNNPTGFTEMIIDDVSLTNNTADEQIRNGDFEDGTGNFWYTYRTGPGEVSITTDDFVDGGSAMNLTASTYYEQASAYSRSRFYVNVGSFVYQKSFQTFQPGDITIDFDWKYSDVENGGTTQYSYFRIYAYNNTFSYNLYFYLGYYDESFPFANSTSPSDINRYYRADNFGTRDVWNHFTLDLYDISAIENITGVPINRIEFYNYASNHYNASTQLLVDNFEIIADPVGDPSFELDYSWVSNDSVIGWNSVNNHQYANITTDAHSGNYAVNTTSNNGYGNAYVYRDMYLPIGNNLYTDFWWKLDHITDTTADYSQIYLRLNSSSYYINYILGSSEGTSFTNSSTECYYIVDNFNSTGTWFNLVRDIAKDTYDAFGSSNWYISNIRLMSYCANTGGKVITLFDDIYFVRDTTPPEISSVGLLNIPMYYDETVVEIVATDLLHPISEVVLSYLHDSTWHPILAIETAENTFLAEIPQFDYGTTIEYFVEAFDALGLSSLDDNSGNNYTYTIDDDIDPLLDIFGPGSNETLFGEVIFYINCIDEGSGISKLTIEIDDTELYNGSALEDYTLVTTNYEDGNHTLTFEVEDFAGNSVLIEKELKIDNPEPPKQALVVLGNLFNWGTLVGAGVVGLGFGIFFLVRFIRIRKAA